MTSILCLVLIFLIILFPFHFQKDNTDVKGLETISFETNPTLTINPELNISIFSPYKISSNDILGEPNSVFLEIWGISGDGTDCWDYYADGSCGSEKIIKEMTKTNGTWTSSNIFPDSIYPEIYFADSETTWANAPLSTSVTRNNYHILHFTNPFLVVDDMFIYIEFNAYPNSTVNSADLQVYLVEKGRDISLFNSSWFNNEGVELVGTFSKDSTFHHKHGLNSSHKLVALSTNIDGTVGPKNIDINQEFWIVLYSQAPNNSRGWNLQYQPSSLCNYFNKWYTGNIQGWNTTSQQGCPDTHIHIARRNSEHMDGVGTTLTAVYDSVQLVSEPVEFYFGELPNLPPTSTSFITPTIGSTYSSSLNINWQPATDPNNDPLYYNIYLKKDEVVAESFLEVTNTDIFIVNTTYLDDGNYTIEGEVCDTINPCVPFSLGGEFTISNTLPIQTITSITLSTDNSSTTHAKNGDLVTLTFLTTGNISTPDVEIYSGGDELNNLITLNQQDNQWTYSYTVNEFDTDGSVTFTIISNTLDREYSSPTNVSTVTIDNTPPQDPTSSLESGTYPSTSINIVGLSSEQNSTIKYTLNDALLNCNNGIVYTNPITISEDSVIKAIACDIAGNISEISEFVYFIKENLLSITLSSSNTSELWAIPGDVITLQFESSNPIAQPEVKLFANDIELTNPFGYGNILNTYWYFEYTVSSSDANGLVTFEVLSTDLYKTFSETTDESTIIIDTVPPLPPIATPNQGIYYQPLTVSLSSAGHVFIRYTTDNSTPSCSQGLFYLYPIGLNISKTIKAVACDQAGNKSPLATYTYFINTTIIPNEGTDPTENIVIETQTTNTTKEIQVDKLEISNEEIILEEQEDTEVTNEKEQINQEGPDPIKHIAKVIRKGQRIYYSEIRIKLTDQNGNEIPNLKLNLNSESKTSITDEFGIARFEMVEVGEHTLSFNYKDTNYQKQITIQKPQIIGEYVELEVITILLENKNDNAILPMYWFIALIILLTPPTYYLFYKLKKK